MNDNQYLARTIGDQLKNNSAVVLVSIAELQGSSPRHGGTKMAVCADGKTIGTVGGSLLEVEAIKSAREILSTRQSRMIKYDLTSTNAYSRGMLCGGKATLLLDYIAPDSRNIQFFQSWQEALSGSRNLYLLTRYQSDGQTDAVQVTGRGLLFSDGQMDGTFTLTPEAYGYLKSDLHLVSSAAVFSFPDSKLLVDLMRKVKTLYCFGAGHVAVPTARLAELVGFRVVVIDDRPDYVTAERFPGAELRPIASFEQAVQGLEIDEDSFIVIFTYGHMYDRTVLEQVVNTQAGYIGMISSRKKRDSIYKAMTENGFSRERLEQVHSPIGLAIGAETPEEIAVSIVAELIKERAHQTR
jgi:xanthine dehydrogenase accessory factor